jgi:hypothetical protein
VSERGLHFNAGKPRVELIPPHALLEEGRAFGYGAETKYSAHNWMKGIPYLELLGSAMRHLIYFRLGQDKDPESGLSHLAHAGACVAMLTEMTVIRPDMDDRPTTKAPWDEEVQLGPQTLVIDEPHTSDLNPVSDSCTSPSPVWEQGPVGDPKIDFGYAWRAVEEHEPLCRGDEWSYSNGVWLPMWPEEFGQTLESVRNYLGRKDDGARDFLVRRRK